MCWSCDCVFCLLFFLFLQSRFKPGPPGALWHADLDDVPRDLMRTRSDAVCSELHTPSMRLRSRSGDSAVLTNKFSVSRERIHQVAIDGTSPRSNGEPSVGMVNGDHGDHTLENGDESDEIMSPFKLPSSNSDDSVFQSSLQFRDIGRSTFYTQPQLLKTLKKRRDFRLSRSLEDLTLSGVERAVESSSVEAHVDPENDSDFCILSYSEPDELNAGGEFVVFEAEGEMEFSGGEDDMDGGGNDPTHMEVKDLTPVDSLGRRGEALIREAGRKRSASALPPKTTPSLLAVFQHRLESIIINIVSYPTGLSFVT